MQTEPKTILVVDDSPYDHELYVRYLQSATHRQYIVNYLSSGNGLAHLQKAPSCMILDLNMPDMSGLDVLKKLKQANDGVLPFPIIIATGGGDGPAGEEAVALGAQDYLVKGEISANSLSRSIDFAIVRFTLKQELRVSEERYKRLAVNMKMAADAGGIGFWSWDYKSGVVEPDDNNRRVLGLPLIGPVTYEQFLETIHEDDLSQVREHVDKCLQTGESYEIEFRVRDSDGSVRWVAAHGLISQDRNGKPNGLIGMAVDISRRKCAEEALRDACEDLEDKVEERTSELKKTLRSLKFQVANRNKAEASMRALSLRLLRTQDEERRMIARNLHDSTGQTLSLLKSNASLLKNSADADGKTLQQLQELCDLADQALVEIRTMSYLLHPPLLDELGLISAIQWYIEGFSKRSGIQVNLDLQDRKKRLPALVETALFRVLQECLTNTFRHSASKSVDIRLHIRRDDIMMSVRDYGKGISPEILRTLESTSLSGGVGLPGMRERVRELGGRIQIQSDCAGTCITVLISAVKLSVSESRKPTGFHGGAKPTNFQA